MSKTYAEGYIPTVKDGKAAIILPLIGKTQNGEVTVSYTHLDVYKRQVEYGDTITISTPGGESYRYTVCDITIYENTDDLRLPTLPGKTLVLATCCPFRYSGNAPGKYVVTAMLNPHD